MQIDIRTLIFIIGISHLLQVLVLFSQYKANKNINGTGWWLLWSTAEVLGFGLILLRNIPALLGVMIVFQDIIILSGTILIYIGMIRFFNKEVNRTFIISFFASFVVLHLFFFFIKDDITIRALLLDVYLSVIAFLTAISIYKNKTVSIALTANLNIAIFLVHGIIFSLSAIRILAGNPDSELFAQSRVGLIQYFDALIVGLLWTFGFIIMLNQKLNSDMSEAKVHFEKIFNTSPDSAVISRLSDGKFIDCNEGFTRIFGYTKAEVLGKTAAEIKIWRTPSDRFDTVKRVEEREFFENMEFSLQRKNGEVITGLMSGKVIAFNEIPHLISLTRDISERKIADQIIKLKNEELLKLNAEKDKLYSIISHDLRSPFQGFLGLTEMLAEELSELTMDEIRAIAERLKDSSVSLFHLLENLLKWSRMQQGLIPFIPEKIQLLSIVNDTLEVLNESAKSKGIKIYNNVPHDIKVFTDNNILQTVIRNLISNAVKFTPRDGEINISTKAMTDNSVEISIKDSGIGMVPEMVDNLFRLDVKTNRMGTDGELSTGLGLLVCKEFVNKFGGTIWVESEEGKGSVFHFTIPGCDH